jgi:hypothetical protein
MNRYGLISGFMTTLLTVLSFASALLLSATSLHAGTPPGKTQQLTSAGQAPEGLEKSDWQSIRAAYEAGRHAFQRTTTGWQARNPGQQWITKFDGRGFIAEPQDGRWQWGLELQSYGFGEEQHHVGGTPEVQADGQRLSYQWDGVVREWFVNDQRGLEHGFTVARRPAEIIHHPSQIINPLSFTLNTRGTLHPVVSADAQGVLFQDAAGAAVLNYSGLKVWDADGRVLTSHFASARGGVRILVDERAARYPLTIDPIAQQAYLKPAVVGTSQVNDEFGRSVAISGDTLVVGAPGESSSTTGVNSTPNESAPRAGAAYVFVRSGGAWTQQAYLKPAAVGTTQAGDEFGRFVAISGDTVIVGAHLEDSSNTGVNGSPNENSADSGAACVFVRSGTNWSQQGYLKPAAVGITQAGDGFGRYVAIDGDTLIVGARNEGSSTRGVNTTPNESAAQAGAAYIYVRSAGVWTQQAYLKPAAVGSSQAIDEFGYSVGVSGDTVVVGAIFEDSNTTGVNSTPNDSLGAEWDCGAAYVFVRNAGVWTQQAFLKPAAIGTTQLGDYFGHSVAISGDTIVVGARNEGSSTTGVNSTPNESASQAGAAYVYVRSAGTWTQQAYLKPATAGTTQASDHFGQSVAISGDTIVAGAYFERSSTTGVNSTPNESASQSGAACVFTRNAGIWTQQAYLKPSAVGTTQAGDWFGFSSSVSGGTVVVGAYGEDSSTTGVNSAPNESASDSGAAYIFTGFGPPEIVVEQPAGTDIADGAAVSFGTVSPGGEAVLTFTIRNTGSGDLTGISAGIIGVDAGSFTVSSAPGAIVPGSGGSTTFSVRFAPPTPGQKTAALRILSNDSDESPFDITFTGTGLTALEYWRLTHFGTTLNAGDAANNADPDSDGLENLVEYAFALNPETPDPAELPAWQKDEDTWTLTFTRPSDVSGITYVAESSDSLAPGSWTPAANAGTGNNFVFFTTSPGPRLYLRLRVIVP